MKRLLLLSLFAAILPGCELGPDGGQPGIGVLVIDARAPLTSGEDVLYEIRYCANSGGESYLVSELRADLEAQGLHWHSGYHHRYELTWDENRDHRFGPGDVLTVSEKDWNDFGEEDAGTTYGVTLYRIPDLGMDEELAKADWKAR